MTVNEFQECVPEGNPVDYVCNISRRKWSWNGDVNKKIKINDMWIFN